jgi:hypothetical protein
VRFLFSVRVYDVPMRTGAEMLAFLARYTGSDERFLKPCTGDGGPVALQEPPPPPPCVTALFVLFCRSILT